MRSIRGVLAQVLQRPTVMMPTRRQFLNGVGAAGGAGAVFVTMQAIAQAAEPTEPVGTPVLDPGSGTGRSVVILGGGIAGLTAAHELKQAGYRCRVLEADSRVGGRVRTLRAGDRVEEVGMPAQTCQFDDGLFFDAGATRIPSSHQTVLGYCRAFGIDLQVFINDNRSALLQSDRIRGGRPVESRQVVHDSAGHISELLVRAIDQRALDETIRPEDADRILKFLKRYGALDRDLAYRGSSRAGFADAPGAARAAGKPRDPLSLSELLDAGFWRWQMHRESDIFQQTTMLQPVGGMDRIVTAFADRVADCIRLDAQVVEIRRRERGVRVVYLDRRTGRHAVEDADHCICTLPFTILAEIDSDFPDDVYLAMEECYYSPAMKLGWQANRRFWEEDEAIYGGVSFVDHDIGQIWYPSHGFHGDKGVIMGGYAVYGAGARLGALTPDQRARAALKAASKLHPQMPRHVTHPISVAWQNMPFIAAGWTQWDADRRETAYAKLLEPQGPIHLAGEHLSYLGGWLEGAILSAHRPVMAIDAEVRRAGTRP